MAFSSHPEWKASFCLLYTSSIFLLCYRPGTHSSIWAKGWCTMQPPLTEEDLKLPGSVPKKGLCDGCGGLCVCVGGAGGRRELLSLLLKSPSRNPGRHWFLWPLGRIQTSPEVGQVHRPCYQQVAPESASQVLREGSRGGCSSSRALDSRTGQICSWRT